MGNFYTNINIKTGYSDDIKTEVERHFLSGYIIISPGWITICSESMEQNDLAASKAMCEITANVKAWGISFLNHDDDVLTMNVSNMGKTVFTYNSDPGYFDGEDQGPIINGIENLLSLGLVNNLFVLSAALKSKDETFAHQKHQRICKILQITEASISASSEYLDGGDYPTGVNESDVIELHDN